MARRPGAAFRIGTISKSRYVGERIGPSSSPRGLLLRGQARISLDPGSRSLTRNPPWRRRRRQWWRRVGRGTHVQPHLVVADVEAGQMLIPQSLDK